MPIIVYALLAYFAGLLSGFSNSVILATAAVGAAAILGAQRVRVAGVAFAALAAGGIVAARSASAEAKRCLVDAEREQSVAIILDDSAYAGAFARGRVHPCDAFASIAVSAG